MIKWMKKSGYLIKLLKNPNKENDLKV